MPSASLKNPYSVEKSIYSIKHSPLRRRLAAKLWFGSTDHDSCCCRTRAGDSISFPPVHHCRAVSDGGAAVCAQGSSAGGLLCGVQELVEGLQAGRCSARRSAPVLQQTQSSSLWFSYSWVGMYSD